MKTPQFAPQEYVSAAIFNNAAVSGVANDVALGKALAAPGIIAPSFASLTPSGTVLVANLPAPFGIFFGTGRLVHAHGALSNADTQTYSVPFSGIIPASGTTTGYLIATSGQIQQNPYQVLGPPPGHPDYNPSFVPYTAYATLTDTLLLAASLTPADNLASFELARFTLNAGTTGLVPDLSYQVASSPLTFLSPNTTSGAVQLVPTNTGSLYNAIDVTTFTLPPVAGINGAFFGFTSSTGGAVAVQVSGAAFIYGTPGAPTSGVTSFTLAKDDTVILIANKNQWNVIGGAQNSSLANVIQAQAGNYALDTGAPNAYSATFNPPVSAYAEGVPYRVKIGVGNTNVSGASTLNCGPSGRTITARDGTTPRPGDIAASGIYNFFYNAGSNTLVCDELAGHRVSFGVQDGVTASGQGISMDANGNTVIQAANDAGSHGITKNVTGNSNVLIIQGANSAYTATFHNCDNSVNTANGAATNILIGANAGTGRSINAGGTVNVSGSDYADYETKADDCGKIEKGQIVGYNENGHLTDKFSQAISFGVKSTDPSYVGGDKWGSDTALGVPQPVSPLAPMPPAEVDEESIAAYTAAVAAFHKLLEKYKSDVAVFAPIIEEARTMVDRIAKAGKIPCIVFGAPKVGEYVIASKGKDDTIIGISVPIPDGAQRGNIVGRIRTAHPSADQIDRLISTTIKRNPAWNAVIEVLHS